MNKNNWPEDIAAMHAHYGVTATTRKLTPQLLRKYLEFRFDFLAEELREGREAIASEDPEEIVDSLIDLCVVAIGTLDAYGVDAQMAWKKVLAANMAKEVGIKASRPNPFGFADLIKPPGWVAPSHASNHGIIPLAFEK